MGGDGVKLLGVKKRFAVDFFPPFSVVNLLGRIT